MNAQFVYRVRTGYVTINEKSHPTKYCGSSFFRFFFLLPYIFIARYPLYFFLCWRRVRSLYENETSDTFLFKYIMLPEITSFTPLGFLRWKKMKICCLPLKRSTHAVIYRTHEGTQWNCKSKILLFWHLQQHKLFLLIKTLKEVTRVKTVFFPCFI